MNKRPQDIKNWLEQVADGPAHFDKNTLQQALLVAEKLSEKNEIPLAENREHGLAIADQLLELKSDLPTILAALVYPFFKTDERTRDMIINELNIEVYKLLLGTKRMEAIDQLPVQKEKVIFAVKQVDNLRRMLLAIVDDVRIVLIKLAERLATLVHLRKAAKEKQQAIAQQTMSLYAPLANRLGIGQLKWQLEDWAFRYLNPKEYNEISRGLNLRRNEREHYIARVQHELTLLLQSANIKYKMSGRAKHIYSIYRKITRKALPFEQIYDTHAFRILVPSIEDCYNVLGLIHEKWAHIPQEFDDYIVKPKPNGYQSIHTVIIGLDKRNVEIQIRTFKMDEAAELGIAAHWKYKEGAKNADDYEEKINLLRDIMKWQQDLDDGENTEHKTVYSKLFEDRIYIFTPKNEIIDLPAKATPLDAAYHIHTQVGHCCRGAKVNGKIVPLTHPLKTGDQIEILTQKNGEPSRDWLNPERGYLTTRTARSKVKAWFIHLLKQEKLAKGQELWEKAAKRESLSKQALTEVLDHFHFKTVEDLLVAVGIGHVSVASIIRRLKPIEMPESTEPTVPEHKTLVPDNIAISGTENLLTKLARCCNPIPGDKIIGYITQGRGVSIHRADCRNIKESMRIRQDRLLEINWNQRGLHAYPVDIEIEAIERPGIIRDISAIIMNDNLRLLSLQSRINTSKNLCHIRLVIEITSLEPLKKLLQQVQQMPDVIRAQRRK